MSKKHLYFEASILTLIGVLIGCSFFEHFTDGYVLKVNFYVGFISWLAVIYFNITKNKHSSSLLLIILLLSSFNIISFYFVNSEFSFGYSTVPENRVTYFSTIGVNPIAILITVIFAIVNSHVSKILYKKIVGHYDSELRDKYKREAKFYYDKFSTCNFDELNYAVKNIKEYPRVAQEALKIVVEQRTELQAN